MVLSLFFIFLIGSQLLFRFSVVTEFLNFSFFLHQFCLNQIPKTTISEPPLSALVCGKNFERLSDMQLYTSTGLIHLFVVSGSHLIILQKILEKGLRFLQLNSVLILFVFLFIYCAMCTFNPPVLRSFIGLILSYALMQKHRYWPKHYILLLTGLFTLALNYNWISSLSLQMSWMAALALEIHAQKFKNTSFLFRQILFYFLFCSSFMLLGFPQFSVVIVCIVLTPILEYILFPFALMTTILHFLEPGFSILIIFLNFILIHLEFRTTPSHFDTGLLISINWGIILICHFWLFSKKIKS